MGRLNLDEMKKIQENLANSGNYGEFDKLVDGKNVRRVLFPKGTSDRMFEEGLVHFGLGAEGKTMVTCPKTFNPKAKCPICEYVDELKMSKSKNDKKLADDLKVRKRAYINVINRDADDEEDTPMVLPVGQTILKQLVDIVCDPDYADITDPKDGKDVTITKKGKGLKTEYTVIPKPKSSPASETLSEQELSEKMTDLTTLFKEQTYEELQDLLNGVEGDEEDEDDDALIEIKERLEELDEDDLYAVAKYLGMTIKDRKKISVKLILANYDEDEITDVLSDLGFLDEEEEEKPKSKKSKDTTTKKKPKPKDDEDEEESDGNEDDEDDDEIKDAIENAINKRRK